MKKFLYLASAATLVLASCSDDFAPGNNQTKVEGLSTLHATYNLNSGLETRTSASADAATGNYKVSWDPGDGIGLYGQNVKNALYAYATGTEGDFGGQVYLEENTTYYGYYPYSEAQTFEDNTFVMTIKGQQNFNYKAYSESDAAIGTATNGKPFAYGSFAAGASPAVAMADAANSEDISMEFAPLGTFLIFPIKGYVSGQTIETIELSIYTPNNKPVEGEEPSESTNYPLAGNFNVDMTNYGKSTFEYPTYKALAEEGLTPNYSITLNCNGITLSPKDPIPFWFVIPADIPVLNATISLSINNGKAMTRTMEASQAVTSSTIWQRGWGYVIGQSSAPGDYWTYSPDYTILETQEQFLEYANLVSTPNAISLWADMYDQAATVFGAGSEKFYAYLSAYTYLPNMLTLPEGVSANVDDLYKYISDNSSDLSALQPKKALIYNNITFNYADPNFPMGSGQGGLNLGGVPEYFYFYTDFTETQGYIKKSIGGQFPFTIEGYDQEEGEGYTALINLGVQGGPMFVGTRGKLAQVNDLDLDGCKVNYLEENENGYAFLARPYYSHFSNVTLDKNCVVTEGLNAVEDAAIFQLAQSSWYNKTNGILTDYDVNGSATDFYFAYDLQVNSSAFEFNGNKGYGIDNFVNITIMESGNGAILTVAPYETGNDPMPTALTEVDPVPGFVGQLIDKVDPQTYGYSVINDGTSYWTGTKYQPNTDEYNTAEELAWYVQGDLNKTFELNMNLNLMGSYTYAVDGENDEIKEVTGKQYWWVSGKPILTVVGSEDYAINNVYINGTTDGTELTGNEYFTLLGNASMVKDLYVNNITIENTGENAVANAYMAAISSWPYINYVSSAYVTGLTVNVEAPTDKVQYAVNGAVGGLYVAIYNDWMNRISTDSDCVFTSNPSNVKYGVIAGQLTYNVSGESTEINSPFTEVNGYTFGKVVLSVTPYSDGGSYVTLNDFAGIEAGNLSLTTASTTKNNYTVYVYDVKGNMTYVYTYSTTTNKYSLSTSYPTE